MNYLIDYAFVNGGTTRPTFAHLVGLNAAGETIFSYRYPTIQLWRDLSRPPHSSGKYEVPDSGASSAQPLYSGARFGR